jgi:hypothetical protein
MYTDAAGPSGLAFLINQMFPDGLSDNEDWSASTYDYRICVAAVKDDMDTVVSLMKRVVDMNLVKKDEFREWPVFISAREDTRFGEEFNKIFGERLLYAKAVASTDDLGTETENEPIGGESDTEVAEDRKAQDPTVHQAA